MKQNSSSILSTLLLALLINHCNSSPLHWGYTDTLEWTDSYTECGFDHQSPIDIVINSETTCDPILLDWTSQSEHFAIRNNGHSFQVIPFEIQHKGGSDFSELEILHHANDTNIRLKNLFYNTFKSPINSEYCIDSLHFHWSEDNNFGSEHAINGDKYPLELHIVHYSCDYYVVGEALDAYSSGANEQYDDNNVLSVIAILFEIGEANPVLDILLEDNIINSVHKYHSNIYNNLLELYYVEFDIIDLLPTNKEIISYLGSLTTPPCYETVRWNVMKNRVSVSEEQMEKFRLMLQSTDLNDTIAPNWRPLQDIGDRILYQCKQDIESLIVNKDKLIDSNRKDGDNTVNEWLVIGIIFICLCVISMIGNIYLLMLRYQNKKDVDDNKSISLIETNKQKKTGDTQIEPQEK